MAVSKIETYGNCEFRFEVKKSTSIGIMAFINDMYLVSCKCTKNGQFFTSYNVRFNEVMITIDYIREILKRQFTKSFNMSVSKLDEELTKGGFK